jgi:hypothetical protein
VVVPMRSVAALLGVLGLIVFVCFADTATSGGDAHGPSCIPPAFRVFGSRPPIPEALSTPLEANILSNFAIFRRPAQPNDEPPTSDLVDGELSRELYEDYELSSYFPAYIRQITGIAGDRRYFVVPAYGRPEKVPPARCFPAGLRRERREVVEHEHRRLIEPVYCIIAVGGSGSAPTPGCEPFAQVDESYRAFHVSDFLGGEPTIELVPDGVAMVRVTYRVHSPIVMQVNENTFLLTPPATPRSGLNAEMRRLLHKLEEKHLTKSQRLRITNRWNKGFTSTYPTRIEWLDGSGGLMRTIYPPTAESGSSTSVGDLRAPIGG